MFVHYLLFSTSKKLSLKLIIELFLIMKMACFVGQDPGGGFFSMNPLSASITASRHGRRRAHSLQIQVEDSVRLLRLMEVCRVLTVGRSVFCTIVQNTLQRFKSRGWWSGENGGQMCGFQSSTQLRGRFVGVRAYAILLEYVATHEISCSMSGDDV